MMEAQRETGRPLYHEYLRGVEKMAPRGWGCAPPLLLVPHSLDPIGGIMLGGLLDGGV